MKTLVFLALINFFCHATFAKQSFTLTSADLPSGRPVGAPFIGHDFGCSGPGQSPALSWTGEPAGTKSFAITMFDTYTPPASGWWHWLVWNLPATTHNLPRNAGTLGGKDLPGGTKQGRPDGEAPEERYYGPCPDVGDKPHHYILTVYALSVDHIDIPASATAAQVDYMISGKTLAKSSLDRAYAR